VVTVVVGQQIGDDRLEHSDLGLPAQLGWAVGDSRGLQLPAIGGHPHQHAAAPVQVHPDDFPAYIGFWGLPTWLETDACNFQHPPGAEARSFIASDACRHSFDLCERTSCAIFPHILRELHARHGVTACTAAD
jgi:hypothetical protein